MKSVTLIVAALALVVLPGCDLLDGPTLEGPISKKPVPVAVFEAETNHLIATKIAEQDSADAALAADIAAITAEAQQKISDKTAAHAGAKGLREASVAGLKSVGEAQKTAAIARDEKKWALLELGVSGGMSLLTGGATAVGLGSIALNVLQTLGRRRERRDADSARAEAAKVRTEADTTWDQMVQAKVEAERNKFTAHSEAWDAGQQAMMAILGQARMASMAIHSPAVQTHSAHPNGANAT